MKRESTMRARHALGWSLVLALVASAWLVRTVQTAAESRIGTAAQADDLAAVRAEILKHADVNAPLSDGSTALLWAVYNNDVEMVKTLVKAGAKVDTPNRYGVTPLLQASRTGAAPMIDTLIKAGADPKLARVEGETPLMAAARAGSVEGVKLIAMSGADVNAQDSFQSETALMWASAEGHADVVKTLLDLGANPNLKAHENAITKREHADFPTGGFTALMWAARNGHDDIVRQLVAKGADLKATNGDGATAMSIAIVNDRFDMAKMLLDLGADPNDGSLFYAIDMHDATTDMRARDGSVLRPTWPNKLTSLQLAQILLDKGADPNKPVVGQLHSSSLCCGSFENGTPFYRAAIASDVAALQLLIDYGADLTWTPSPVKQNGEGQGGGGGRGANANVGKTAAMMAMVGGKGAPFGGGPGFNRQGPPPFREAGDRKPIDALKVLLDAGADPNAAANDGTTALHTAAQNSDIDMIKMLASYGANLEAKNKDGKTPLDLAERKLTSAGKADLQRAIVQAQQAGVEMPKTAKPEEVIATLRDLMGLPAMTDADLAKAEAAAKTEKPKGGPGGNGAANAAGGNGAAAAKDKAADEKPKTEGESKAAGERRPQ